MKNTLASRFFKVFGNDPEILSIAPGRINLIGEHVDYHLGFVLPAAIDKNIKFLVSKRPDKKIVLWADDFNQSCRFSLDRNEFLENLKWANYVKGVLWVLGEQGYEISGINAYITGDVPLEAGLSSSAALEMSVILGLNTLFELGLPRLKMIEMGQRAENEFVGVRCGIMDQFISAFGKKDHAVLLDCQSLEFESIPFDLEKKGLEIVVYNSRVRRELTGSEYNKRRSESGEALELLKKSGIQSFREASLDLVEKHRKIMDEKLYKRTKHVISENQRVLLASDALRTGDFKTLGRLLYLSHESLRDDYEVSCDELDLLYDTAKKFDGCLGARMTGAGFGGSGIALLSSENKRIFQQEVFEEARNRGFREPVFYDVEIGEGADAYKV